MHCAHCGTETDELPCPSCGADPRVVGRYRLEEMLGQGAHGTTWRAVDDETGEARAVKELPLRLGTPDKVVTLFRREASVLRQLKHAGVPVCHDAIEVGEGRQRALWIVLDLIDGHSLQRELEGHRYDEREVLHIMGELLEILEYLHNLSPPVVHRDIKPANVLRGPDGKLVLVDFGSVRDALRQSDLGGSTVAGTFGYMAPEQFAGDAEPATDLYGLGALAVHLLTRQAPHKLQDRGGNMDFRSHLRVSDGLATLLDRLLAREPVDRPRSAAHAHELVRRVRAGDDLVDDRTEGVPTDPTPTPVPAPMRTPTPTMPRSRAVAGASPAPLTPAPRTGASRIALTGMARRRLTVQDHGAAVSLIEHELNLSGRASNIGETLRWSADSGPNQTRTVQVTVEPHLDGSRILLSENLSPLYGGTYGGIIGGLGGGVGGGVGWVFFAFMGVVPGIIFVGSVLVFTILLATGFVRQSIARRQPQARRLVQGLSAQLGGAAAPLPPAPPVPNATAAITMASAVLAAAAVGIIAAWLTPGMALIAMFAVIAVWVVALVAPFASRRGQTVAAEPEGGQPQLADVPTFDEDTDEPDDDTDEREARVRRRARADHEGRGRD